MCHVDKTYWAVNFKHKDGAFIYAGWARFCGVDFQCVCACSMDDEWIVMIEIVNGKCFSLFNS